MMTREMVATTEPVSQACTHLSFWSMVRGEFLKVARLFWLLFGLMAVGFLGAMLLQGSTPHLNLMLQQTPLLFCYDAMESSLSIFRMLSGILLLILTSFVIGREYQYGTIRLLLERGVGRLQLLLAKLAFITLIALMLLVAFALITAIFLGILMLALVGNLNALHALAPAFWSNAGRDLLAVLVSMRATILLVTAMNSLGRSLTFGLSASLVWFPLDNFGALLLNVVATVTRSDFWRVLTAYLLGPLLNHLPDELLPHEVLGGFGSFGAGPLVPVSTAQALSVIGLYALIFLAVAFGTTWKRDIKE